MAGKPGQRKTIIERVARIADSRQHPAISTVGPCTKRKRNKMTDLDRKIAELKGWNPGPIEDGWPKESGDCLVDPDGACAYVEGRESPLWSTSDAKAFELVDELKGDGIHFMMICHDGDNYVAFNDGVVTEDLKAVTFKRAGEARASARPEAICRAYIALKEWEGKK